MRAVWLVLYAASCAALERGGVVSGVRRSNSQRWAAASDLLSSTAADRRRWDHRAYAARLAGLYVNESTQSVMLIAVQPDRSDGRKLIFLDDAGAMLGHLLLGSEGNEARRAAGDPPRSALRGMRVSAAHRGRGVSTLLLAIWLRMCLSSHVTPATSRINKPLLALTLTRLGFRPPPSATAAPVPGQRRTRALVVEVSVGSEGRVDLFSATASEQLAGGFSATEMRSQRLVIVAEPAVPRGRAVHIRTPYEWPAAEDGEETMMDAGCTQHLTGGGLALSSTQDPAGAAGLLLSAEAKLEVLRVLTGRI